MEKILSKLGLGQNEVNIYLYLLKKGRGKVTEISKGLNIARTSVYRFLDILQNKGFISHNIQRGVQIFYPLEPSKILANLENIKDEFNSILPELEKLSNNRQENIKVEVFKGREGIKLAFMDIAKEGKDYICVGEAEKGVSELEYFNYQWLNIIKKKNMKGRLLVSKDQNFIYGDNEELRYFPDDMILETSRVIYGNKTIEIIWNDIPETIIIESEDLAKSNRKQFEYLWEKSVKK